MDGHNPEGEHDSFNVTTCPNGVTFLGWNQVAFDLT